MDGDTNLEAEHRLKQASPFKKLSALSPGAISPHDNSQTQQVLSSHLTAGIQSVYQPAKAATAQQSRHSSS